MTMNEKLDFVADHLHDQNEELRVQAEKYMDEIMKTAERLEQEASHVVVPDNGVTAQDLWERIVKKLPV